MKHKLLLLSVYCMCLHTFLFAQFPPCPSSITLSTQQTNVNCFGGLTGSATVTVSGGSGNYQYTWAPTGGNAATASGLAAGSYTVGVLNVVTGGGTGVIYSENFNGASVPWTLNTAVGTNDAQSNFWTIGDGESGMTPPNCGMGGQGNPTLHIDNQLTPGNGATYNAGGLCAAGICVQTNKRANSPDISTVGNTGLTLTFNYIGNGQMLTDNAFLVYSTNGGVNWTTLANSLKSPTCPNGQGQWTAASYPLPAACENIPNLRIGFVWQNNDDGIGTDPSFAVDDIQITASSGAPATCYLNANVTITQPASAVTATATSTALSCSGGNNASASVSASGGTGPYTYTWNTGQFTQTITGLGAGTYSCTVVDASGCTSVATTAVSTPGLTATATTTSVGCFGQTNGTATANVTVGTPPYNYSWSNGQTSATATGLAGGTYTCYISDATGCTGSVSAVITGPTAPLTVSLSGINPGCSGVGNDGSITAIVTGGTAPFTYSWSNGASGVTIGGLSAGTYTCFVTDSKGCTSSQFTTLVNSTGLSTATSSTPCSPGMSNGTATVTVSGGTAPYSYTWNVVPPQFGPTASGLAPGLYTCIVSDAAGCSKQLLVGVEEAVSISPETLGFTQFSLAPNPTQTYLELHAQLATAGSLQLAVYDFNGRILYAKEVPNATELHETLDTHSWASGIYLLRIGTDKGTLTQKVIKE